jgi:hypothetical protein
LIISGEVLHELDVATDMFPAEEYGSGSRLTPLVDAPAWVKAQARREASPDGDRATLTPDDRAFLESIPSYGPGDEESGPLTSLPPPALPAPSTLRRVMSLLLFATIATGACAVLGLAVLRMLGRVVLP